MHPSQSTISAEVAHHVLHHFGYDGVQAGSFTTHLLDAIIAADSANLARLANSFPEEVAAVRLAKFSRTGIESLQAIAQEPLAPVVTLRLVEVGQ